MRQAAVLALILILILPGCAAPTPTIPAPTATLPPTATAPVAQAPAADCSVAVARPTVPATIPGYTQLDPSTGLHMTGKPVQIDPATYRLAVTGSVNTPLSLALDVLRCMPKITSTPVLICKGYFEDVAEWSGVPLSAVLDQAGLQQGARRVTLVGADGYEAELSLETALRDDSYLAYEWSGEPLPVLHGYPLRAVIASELGNKWVKWLVEVRVE